MECGKFICDIKSVPIYYLNGFNLKIV